MPPLLTETLSLGCQWNGLIPEELDTAVWSLNCRQHGKTLLVFHRLAATDHLDYTSIMHEILVIDDDAVFVETLAEAMKRGHRDINIKTATTAEQGLRLLGRQRFDAVVSDFRMPGLNGIDLLQECAVACPDMPVVVLTGYGSRALEQDALHHGAYAVLQKPVDSDVIYSAVTRAILRSQMLQRGLPSAFTPPDIHLRELVNHRERLSAKLKVITQRLDDTLGTDKPE